MLPEQFCVRMKEMLGEEYAAFYASYDLPKYQSGILFCSRRRFL